MNEKIIIEGRLKSSKIPRPSNEMGLDELIARIKFKRTIRRLIKLINSK
jgi:hypothetical protein